MKTMLEIAYAHLDKNGATSLTQLFSVIKKELKSYWKEDNSGKLITKIEEEKLGALYAFLTTDGRFVMVGPNEWTINTKLTSKEFLAAKSRVIIDNIENKEKDFADDQVE